jgi:hypothetical protein
MRRENRERTIRGRGLSFAEHGAALRLDDLRTATLLRKDICNAPTRMLHEPRHAVR